MIYAAVSLFVVPFLFLMCAPTARAAPGGFTWPVQGTVLRGFEKPTGPYGEGGHQGVDIAAGPGEAVRAAGDGVVGWVGELPRGRCVSIAHQGGVKTTYLDLDMVSVATGAAVRRGQVIATVAGRRDDSSPQPHLHFGASANGHPVDPRLLIEGFDDGSFVRLCPVERRPGAAAGSGAVAGGWQATPGGTGRPPAGLESGGAVTGGPIGMLKRGLREAWGGVCALGRAGAAAWSRGLSPALRGTWSGVARFVCWAWSNRYVQAVTAGLAASVVIILCVVAAYFLLPISAAVAIAAAVAGSIACIGVAIYCAATGGRDFTFGTCFLKSLSAGAIAASAVVSWGSLSAPVAAGWAKVGLSGTLKAAAWNGLFSTIFDSAATYLLTGRISWRGMLVAFAAGALTGGLGKVLREGIVGERLVGVLSVTASETKFGVASFAGSALASLRQTAVRIEGLLVVIRQVTLTSGGKLAYVLSWGMLTAGINAVSCAVTHRPLTAAGILASFFAGAAMGGIALSFRGRGISGMLSRFRVFRGGVGVRLRRYAARLIGKGLSRGIKSGLESGFRKLSGEKEASR